MAVPETAAVVSTVGEISKVAGVGVTVGSSTSAGSVLDGGTVAEMTVGDGNEANSACVVEAGASTCVGNGVGVGGIMMGVGVERLPHALTNKIVATRIARTLIRRSINTVCSSFKTKCVE